MRSLALYPIYVDGVKPHFTLQKAFEDEFNPCFTYDWMARKSRLKKLSKVHEEFLAFLKKEQPEYCFMQLQNPMNMTVQMIREMSKYTKIINWTGDIRLEREWYKWFEEIGKLIHLTLFTNEQDAELMRLKGVRADYLQVGYDHNWYYPDPKIEKTQGIVFSAHNYGKFPLSDYRLSCALALREEFGDQFKLFGGGWDKYGFKTTTSNNKQEADAYRAAKIGISISNFDFERYHSDRLLRIMACGCLPMSHNYKGLEKDYQDGHNIVSFNDETHLVDLCRKYLSDEAERNRITQNALIKAQTSCTWDSRMDELHLLLNKYEDNERK